MWCVEKLIANKQREESHQHLFIEERRDDAAAAILALGREGVAETLARTATSPTSVVVEVKVEVTMARAVVAISVQPRYGSIDLVSSAYRRGSCRMGPTPNVVMGHVTLWGRKH